MVKDRWLIVSAAILFLAETGLQMSGIQNIYISVAIWIVMLGILAWAISPAIKGIWAEVRAWTEPQKTLAVLIFCLFVTTSVLMLLASRRTLLSEAKREQRVQWMIGLEDTEPAVVETNIRTWLNKSPYSVKKEVYKDSIWNFAFTVTTTGRQFTVGQLKQDEESKFITFIVGIHLDDKLKTDIAKLSESKRRQLTSELRIELVRLRAGYSSLRLPLENLQINAKTPIIGLTEWDFMERVRLMDGVLIVVVEKINSFLAAQS